MKKLVFNDKNISRLRQKNEELLSCNKISILDNLENAVLITELVGEEIYMGSEKYNKLKTLIDYTFKNEDKNYSINPLNFLLN